MGYRFNFRDVFAQQSFLLEGLLLTLQLSFIAMALGLAVGVTCAALRVYGPRPARLAVAGYVEAIRNTPLLVQLFLVFFGLPSLGIRLDATTAAIIALTVNLGAYATEIVRAGLEAIPRAQIEAGRLARAVAPAGLPLRRAVAGAQGHVPGAREPVHPADAGDQHRLADLGAGPLPHRLDHPVAHLPRLRGLHRRRGALSRRWRSPSASPSPALYQLAFARR